MDNSIASRRYTSQFSYSFEKFLVRQMIAVTQSGSTGTFATISKGGVTGTAVTMGTGGNSITLAYTAGGTAGAEVVTVSGNAISVQIESTVSTVTQVRTALNASAAAAALATFLGTSASTVAAAAATSFATGTSTAFTYVQGNGQQFTVTQTGTGIFSIAIPDSYVALIGASFMLQRATAVDLKAQLQSSDVTTAKTVVFRTIAVATPTNLASGDTLFITLDLRNSSSP